MGDNLSIQLDGSQVIQGVDDVLSALREFKAAIAEFSRNDPTGRVRAEAAGLTTAAVTVVQAFEKTLGGVRAAVAKEMAGAAVAAKAGGKKIAQSMTDGMQDADVAPTVREMVKRMQAEYERALASGWSLKGNALANLRLQGVSLSPEDRVKLADYLKANKDFATLYKVQLREIDKLQNEELAQAEAHAQLIANASRGVAKLRASLSAQALAQEQADANRTYQMRERFARSEQAQLEAKEKMLARAARGIAKLRAQMNEDAAAMVTRSVTAPDPRTLLGLPPDLTNRSAKSSADVFMEAGLLTKSYGKLKEGTSELGGEQKRLAQVLNRDVHSALRGVSGAAGMLWLTYGTLLPLMTAFAATAAVRTSVKDWAALEYQLKFVQAVAEDTSVSIAKMMESVSGSAMQAGVSPIEAAKGLRLLAQAGLDTTQALEALPTVLAVSKVGELDMATAAETLTGATFALGVGLDNIGRVGDVFVKAAAVSNTSVSSISESMKQASTVAQQYKLSVEDVSTALVALAKRNITGSQAGTAFRSMMDEFAVPKGDAQKVAKQLGITLFDPIKNDAKDFFNRFIPELREKLKVFDPQSQVFIMNRLTNNRGAKALGALLGMSDADLAEIHNQLEHATGMASRALIDMNDTLQGRFDQFKSQLTSSFSQAAMQGSEPLKDSLERLRDVVASPEFIAAVRALVVAFDGLVYLAGTAAQFLTSGAGGITGAAAAIGGAFYLMQGGAKSAATEVAEVGAQSAAAAAATRAAASGAAGLLATFARFTLVTAVITGTLIALGMLYEKLSEKDAIDKSKSYTDDLIKKEQEYQKTLDSSIEKLKIRLGLAFVPKSAPERQQHLLDASSQAQDALGAYHKALADAGMTESEFLAAQKRVNSDPTRSGWMQNSGMATVSAAYQQWLALADKYKKAVDADTEALRLQAENQRKAAEERELQIKAATQEAERLKGALGVGTKHFQEIDPNAAYNNAKKDLDNQLRAIEDARAQADREEKFAEDKAKFRYDVGITSWQQYQDELGTIQQDAQKSRLDALVKELEIEEKAQAELKRLADARDPKTQPGQSAANDLAAMSEKVNRTKAAISNAVAADEKRQNDALKAALQPSAALVNNFEKESALLKTNFDQEMRRVQLKTNSLDLSERELYIQQEIARATNSMEDQLSKLLAARADLLSKFDFSDANAQNLPEGAAKRYQQLSLDIIDLQKMMADAKTTAGSVAAEAFDKQKISEISKNLRGGIADAIIEGGADGRRKLRDELEDELIKKPFKMVLEAELKPFTDAAASMIYSAFGLNRGGGTGGFGAMNPASLFNLGSIFNGDWSMSNVGTTGAGLGGFLGFGGGGGMFSAAASQTTAATDAFLLSDSVYGGSTLAAGGSALSTMLPYVGWALAAYQLLNGAFKGETRSGGQYGYSFDGSTVFNPRRGTTQGASGIGATFLEGPSGGDQNQYAAISALNGTAAMLNTIFANLGTDTRLTGLQGGYESSDKGRGGVFTGGTLTGGITFGESGRGDNYAGTLYEKTSPQSLSIEEAFQNFLTDQKQSVIEALQAYAQTAGDNLPNTIRAMLTNVDAEKLSDTDAQALIDKINATIDGVKGFWDAVNAAPVAQLKNLAFDVAATLVKLSGGIDQFRANLQSYVQNFYSSGDQRSAIVHSIGETLRKAGLNVTDQDIGSATREQFRALAESLDVTTDKGATAYAALMGVNGAFASITTGSEDVQSALEDQKSTWQDTVDQIKSFQKSLEDLKTSLQLGDLSPLSPMDKYATARSNLESLYQKALGGDKDAQNAFSSAAQDFLKQSQGVNASSDYYTSDYNYVQGLITALQSVEGSQLTDAQQHVVEVQQQIDAMTSIKTAVEGSGIDIVTAIGDLNTTAQAIVTAVQQVIIPAAGGGTGVDTGGDTGGTGGDTGGGGGGSGWPQPDVMPYADGGFNPGGWSLVGEEGPELINFSAPSRIYTASQTRAALGGGIDTEMLQMLVDSVNALRAESRENARLIAQTTAVASKQSADAIVDGTHEAVGRGAWRADLSRRARIE